MRAPHAFHRRDPTLTDLNDLVTDLSESFDDFHPDGWTQEHICRGE